MCHHIPKQPPYVKDPRERAFYVVVDFLKFASFISISGNFKRSIERQFSAKNWWFSPLERRLK
jgi:hypothetical protein